MTSKSISDFHKEIEVARTNFRKNEKLTLSIVQNPESTTLEIQESLSELHTSAINFFSTFEQSITQFSFLKYFTNTNVRNEKLNESIAMSNTIILYWNVLKLFTSTISDLTPYTPSLTAYSTIQTFINEFDPEEAKNLKTKFKDAGLPIRGFTKQTFTDMTKKNQIKFGAIAGLCLMIALLIITLIVECPTSFQGTVFTIILALAGAAFASIIPGVLDVKFRQTVTAGGALAVFAVIFFAKPVQISDFKSCQSDISGTVYFGNKPFQNISIAFPKQSQSTTTDNFGNFKLALDISSVDDSLMIQLANKELSFDSTYFVEKSDLSKSIDLYIPKFCIKCNQKDSTNTVVNSAPLKCSGSSNYINTYIEGYKRSAMEQGRTVECIRQ